ncbi:Protein N-terminal glutamine amidohydrolase [Trebouxia sp. C0010 RCD-2024]
MTSLISADCVYTPCFCEENAYKLCERLIQEPCELYVAFTSNRQRQVSGVGHAFGLFMKHAIDVVIGGRYPCGVSAPPATLLVLLFGITTCWCCSAQQLSVWCGTWTRPCPFRAACRFTVKLD